MLKTEENFLNKVNKFYKNINPLLNKVNQNAMKLFNLILLHSYKEMESYMKWMDLNYVLLIMDHALKISYLQKDHKLLNNLWIEIQITLIFQC
jgi:hypothetical protein